MTQEKAKPSGAATSEGTIASQGPGEEEGRCPEDSGEGGGAAG